MLSKRGQSWGWAGFLPSLLGLACGCVTPRTQIEQALLTRPPAQAHFEAIAAAYQAHCPDVLRVDIAGLPQCSGTHRIEADGRIPLGHKQAPVDGDTVPEITRTVAQTFGVALEQVHVEVVTHNSQFLYLFGEVAGLQRAVPYQGPETVFDLLRRVGGFTEGAATSDIIVLRPHVADGKRPEVFHVDLAAIVLRNDPDTNIALEPFDQIHIGQSRRSLFRNCLPPWLWPMYDRLCGMKPRRR